MPAPPAWLRALPDAIEQLERTGPALVTRRDVELLLGVSRARAAQLMRQFGAGWTGSIRTLPREELIRIFREYVDGARFRAEEHRVDRIASELRRAQRRGPRATVSTDILGTRLANLPAGVVLEPGRIEVTYDTSAEAIARLYGLIQALANDPDLHAFLDGKGRHRLERS